MTTVDLNCGEYFAGADYGRHRSSHFHGSILYCIFCYAYHPVKQVFPDEVGVGKFSLITLLFLAYAWYNTFWSFGMVTVLGYAVILVIMVCNYRDVIRDGFHLLKKQFS